MTSLNIEPATSHFATRGVTEPPVITQAFHPGAIGWFAVPISVLATPERLRGLREAGFTSVQLTAGPVRADFQLSEFWSERVGLGHWHTERSN